MRTISGFSSAPLVVVATSVFQAPWGRERRYWTADDPKECSGLQGATASRYARRACRRGPLPGPEAAGVNCLPLRGLCSTAWDGSGEGWAGSQPLGAAARSSQSNVGSDLRKTKPVAWIRENGRVTTPRKTGSENEPAARMISISLKSRLGRDERGLDEPNQGRRTEGTDGSRRLPSVPGPRL